MKRRLLASLLTLVMMLSLLPTAVWAANGKGQDEQTVYAVGEEIPVSGLSGEVTISGYMDEKDWYVTDGLVLMYDGIYNEGMNQTIAILLISANSRCVEPPFAIIRTYCF